MNAVGIERGVGFFVKALLRLYRRHINLQHLVEAMVKGNREGTLCGVRQGHGDRPGLVMIIAAQASAGVAVETALAACEPPCRALPPVSAVVVGVMVTRCGCSRCAGRHGYVSRLCP